MNYALIISIVSLIVSLVTLYLRELQKPAIKFQVGSTIGFCRIGDGFEIYVPATFFNTAQRLGVVSRCSVVVWFPNNTSKGYYLEWTEFRKQEARKWVREDFAGPITVAGRASVSKILYFRWSRQSVDLPPGEYAVTFYVWLPDSPKPVFESTHHAELSPSEVSAMVKPDDPNLGWPVRFVPLDEQLERNKLFTKHEITELLSGKDS
jgi:hypothetical protein